MRQPGKMASWRVIVGLLALPAASADESAPACQAQSPEECIASCRQKYPEDRDKRFACFDQAEATSRQSNLMRLWFDGGELISFAPYRQSYMLFTRTDHPNNAPTSPNPIDRVPPSYDLQHDEAKFQFSLKALVFRDATFGHGGRTNVWFAYTQQSYWQVFDGAHSSPFRESNYEPELIVSHPLTQTDTSVLGMRPAFVNFGLVHQSNGQSDPGSRSWNRVYAQLGLDKVFAADSSLAVLLRPWWRFREAPQTDNNADITHYLGYGDVEVLYWNDPYTVSALARIRSVQLDVSRRIWPSPGGSQARTIQLHLQLFTGYGESLIDYNQSHTTVGVGISVPYGL